MGHCYSSPAPVLEELPKPMLKDLPLSLLEELPTSVLEKLPSSILDDLNNSILEELTSTWENTKPYIPNVTKGYVIKVYDGDTITISSRIPGDFTNYRFSVRLRGIDCPEMNVTEQKDIAMIAQKMLSDHILGKKVYLQNVGLDKYGRLLADVEYDGKNVTSLLLDAKLAIYYNGGKKKLINWKKYYDTGILTP